MSGDPIKARRTDPTGKPLKTREGEWYCVEDGCETKLSRYNHSEYCWQHQPIEFHGKGKHDANRGAGL